MNLEDITRLNTEPLLIYEPLHKYIERINASVENDPSLAIGSTKELIESTLKIILDGCSYPYDNKDDIPKLLKKVQTVLKLVPDDVHDSKKGAETIKKVLSNLSSVVVGTAELRNLYGSGHGRGQKQKLQGITSRHAKLVISSGTALCMFLLETYEHRENLDLAHLKSKSWQHLHTLEFTPLSRVRCIGIDPSGQLLASGGEDHIVRIWKLDTGELLSQHKRYYHEQRSGDVNSLTFSHDGKLIISTGFVSGARDPQDEKQRKIQFLNWETGEVVSHLPPFPRFKSGCSIALCPSQDVIAFDSGNNIELYNFKVDQYLKTLKGHSKQVSTIAFSPDSKILASGSKDGQVKIWDWEAETFEIFNNSTAINTVAISYDNQFLAIGSVNSSIILFNLITQKVDFELDSNLGSVASLVFSPDGRFLAGGGRDNDAVKVWHVKTGELLHSLECSSCWQGVLSVSFSQDSQILAASLAGGAIKVWQQS